MPLRDPVHREAARRFGRRLDAWLDERELRPADLARRLNKDSSVISKWRRGEMLPTPETCRELGEVLLIPHEVVLREAGHLAPDGIAPSDALRREIVALLPLIPDDLLRPLPAMLRGLVPTRPSR